MKSKMVKCVNTGTKYDGIAGEIDHNGIVKKNGYLEIPIIIEFDNGTRETLIVTNEMVEVFA